MDISIAQRVARWRAHRGLTLQQVATAAGVSKQMVSYLELGETDIATGKLAKICEVAFRCDMATFFGPLPDAMATRKRGRAA